MSSRTAAMCMAVAVLGISFSDAAQDAAQHPTRKTQPSPPFRDIVSLPTFMEHVLSPAADVVWRASGTRSDTRGEHDLAPATDAQWEAVVSGAATLAESTNALMIPQRKLNSAWYPLVLILRDAAQSAYQAAEAHDPEAIALAGQRIDSACTSCHKYYGLE